MSMRVEYRRGTPGLCNSNIIFPRKWPMRGGKFPKDHPCASNPEPMIFYPVPATSDPLGNFRSRGYANASCFPEGDGITFTGGEAKADSEVIRDITECFGWEVNVQKP